MDTATAVPPPDAVLSWARNLYANAVDKKDARGFAQAFTDDAMLRFGNNEPLQGRAAIEAAIAGFFDTFATLRHEEKETHFTGDTLILEAVVTYERHDGGTVSVPAVTIFHFIGAAAENPRQPVADECRIYVDLTPLYAAR